MSKAKTPRKPVRAIVEKIEVASPNVEYAALVHEAGGVLQVADALRLDPKTVNRRSVGSTPLTREMFYALANVGGKTDYVCPL